MNYQSNQSWRQAGFVGDVTARQCLSQVWVASWTSGWSILAAFVFLIAAGLATHAIAADVEYTIDPRAKQSVARAVTYLKSDYKEQHGGYKSLYAYTFLKAGDPPTSPEITDALAEIRRKCQTTGYTPHDVSHGIYEAATDIMLLADANPGGNQSQIATITQFILQSQRPDGAWTYAGIKEADSSITQYGMLGLWAAERAGVRIPMSVWSNAAKWFVATQMKDGGFTYWPGTTNGAGGGNSYSNMAFAGTACLLLSRIYIYGELPMYGTENRPKPKKFGVLDNVKAQTSVDDWVKRRSEVADVVPLASLDQGIARGLAWITSHWVTSSVTGVVSRGYFYYSLERVGALSASDKLGGHDWFNECLPVAIGFQAADGSWDDGTGKPCATALSTLFLTRTTGRIIEKMNIGGGLLTGGRGLPDDLAKASLAKGKVAERKSQGGLDDLLGDLAKADASFLEETQAAIVEKVQIGSRQELLGQMETVRKLIKNPNPEIRRTAVWALGRSGNIGDALLLIQTLHDNDVDVLVEVNASLKYLSRKLAGVGVPESPFIDLPENANDAQKIAAVAAWRRDALKRWTGWYTRVRPFQERNDLFELLNRTSD